MRRAIGEPGRARAAIATVCGALACAAVPAHADDSACKSVKAAGEIKTLRAGQVIYADLAAKVRIRITTIDAESGEICGRTRRGRKCYKSDKVYTGRSLAACGRGAGAGAILLFGDDEDEDGEEER